MIRKFPLHCSLKSRVTLKVLSLFGGFTIVFFIFCLAIGYGVIEKSQEDYVNKNVKNLSGFLSAQLYYYDSLAINKSLNDFIALNGFEKISLFDRYDNIVGFSKKDNDKALTENPHKIVEILGSEGFVIGYLYIWFGDNRLSDDLKLFLFLSLSLFNSALLILGGGFIRSALQSEVIKPMLILRNAFVEEKKHTESIFPETFKSTEFLDLFNTFSRLTTNLLDEATIDHLTGLVNRRHIMTKINQKLVDSKLNNSGFFIIYIDVDNFKRINDYLGHSAGDELLREIAKRLKQAVNEESHVSRLGGDEFLILYQGEEELTKVNSHIIDEFDRPFHLEGRSFPVSCSLGFSRFPNDGDSVEDLIRKADLALYHAKRSGRRCGYIFDDALLEENNRWMELSDIVNHSINSGKVFHATQPIVSINDGNVWGHESLLRIPLGNGQYADPIDAIKVARDLGKLDDISRVSVDNAIHALGVNSFSTKITVNFSREQIIDFDILDYITFKLKHSGVDRSGIIIEVTEDSLLQDNAVLSRLEGFVSAGFDLALDDFGTGHSSIACLWELPLSVVKFDKSLLGRALENKDGEVVFSGIVAMARQMKLKILIEGIEDERGLELAQRYGCGLGQGYYFGKPSMKKKDCHK